MWPVGLRGERALASPYRSIPNRAMHIQTSASKPKATLKDGLNELLKIGSYKLFAWPFDTATRPGKGADIDYNHDKHYAFNRHFLDN